MQALPAEIRNAQRVPEAQIPKPRRQIPDMLQVRQDRDEPEPARKIRSWKSQRRQVRAMRQDFFLYETPEQAQAGAQQRVQVPVSFVRQGVQDAFFLEGPSEVARCREAVSM